MFAKLFVACCTAALLSMLLKPFVVQAQESAILDKIQSGEIKGKSLLALPPNNVAEIPGLNDDDAIIRLQKKAEENIVDRAYPLMAAKWPFNKVFVCWEELDEAYYNQRTLVREAVKDTWEAHSALQFVGWNKCNPGQVGIRIHIEDTGPHVKALGKFVSGMPNGMVLNFTYKNWSTSCQTKLDYCTRVIAVHEFGHAIGFAHEQNRPDTPGECDERPQGQSGDKLLTPWDPHSVMNYCNATYANDGALSEFDVVGVQYVYGAR